MCIPLMEKDFARACSTTRVLSMSPHSFSRTVGALLQLRTAANGQWKLTSKHFLRPGGSCNITSASFHAKRVSLIFNLSGPEWEHTLLSRPGAGVANLIGNRSLDSPNYWLLRCHSLDKFCRLVSSQLVHPTALPSVSFSFFFQTRELESRAFLSWVSPAAFSGSMRCQRARTCTR